MCRSGGKLLGKKDLLHIICFHAQITAVKNVEGHSFAPPPPPPPPPPHTHTHTLLYVCGVPMPLAPAPLAQQK